MFDLCKDRKELTRVKGRDTTDRSSSTDLCVAKFKKCICVKLSSQQQIAKRHVCAVYIMYFTVVIPRTMFVQYVACNHKMHNGTTFLNAAFSLNSPSRELQPARRRRRSRSRRLVRFATVSNTSVTAASFVSPIAPGKMRSLRCVASAEHLSNISGTNETRNIDRSQLSHAEVAKPRTFDADAPRNLFWFICLKQFHQTCHRTARQGNGLFVAMCETTTCRCFHKTNQSVGSG